MREAERRRFERNHDGIMIETTEPHDAVFTYEPGLLYIRLIRSASGSLIEGALQYSDGERTRDVLRWTDEGCSPALGVFIEGVQGRSGRTAAGAYVTRSRAIEADIRKAVGRRWSLWSGMTASRWAESEILMLRGLRDAEAIRLVRAISEEAVYE